MPAKLTIDPDLELARTDWFDELGPTLTVVELARLERISPKLVYKHLKHSGWPYTKYGREFRFDRDQVRMIRQMQSRPAAEPAAPAPRARRSTPRRTRRPAAA
ncbi:hypothetical protein [Embleya sp. NPDC020630]|uniref:hypothetical protein n=1 Tax=Embleya sp. NPDC020630 TaxID=3363979 RepID=UPI0037AA9A49